MKDTIAREEALLNTKWNVDVMKVMSYLATRKVFIVPWARLNQRKYLEDTTLYRGIAQRGESKRYRDR